MNARASLQQEIPFETLDPERVRLESARKQCLDMGRNRIMITALVFLLAFGVLGGRVVMLTAFGGGAQVRAAHGPYAPAPVVSRGDIVDRNGQVLATSLPTQSLYADPKEVLDAAEAAHLVAIVLADVSEEGIKNRLDQGGRFQWLARNLTPEQVYAVNRLGIPGLGFRDEERRVYPFGRIFAHVLGYTDVDGQGIAGIERNFDRRLGVDGGGVQLSLDLGFQTILHQELSKSIERFEAKGAAGVILDVRSGEVLAMVSLPDFDPNAPEGALSDAGFNRATKGVYEMGSTFKLFTTAMALDTGSVKLTDRYDASEPIRAARFTINDFHGENRLLTVPEILVYSSNIGTAKMALDVGPDRQREYLGRLGLLSAPSIELPEVGLPLYPNRWGEISTMTISYGHGIAVSPIQVASGVAALVNGGILYPATLLKRKPGDLMAGEAVIQPETSDAMRALMRLVVRHGTGRNADVEGYLVGGKTGTAEKQVSGTYEAGALISSFVGVFPMDDPRYLVLAVVDEPHGRMDTYGYATGGWVAAPVVARVVERIGVLSGIVPEGPNVLDENRPGSPYYIPAKGTAEAGGGTRAVN